MLAIRMQRVGRKGHAQFRMIVQDSRFHPTSGRVVAYLGNYDPHSKQAQLNTEMLEKYIANGAQPSPRVVKLLKIQKIKLPDWVDKPSKKKKEVKNPDKRRSTRPPEAEKPDEPVTETTPEAPVEEVDESTETPAEKPDNLKADTSEEVTQTEEPEEAPKTDEQLPAESATEQPAEPTK